MCSYSSLLWPWGRFWALLVFHLSIKLAISQRCMQWWFISYVCSLTLCWVIVTNEMQYSYSSQIFHFFKIAEIRALCMLLNLIKYCSHWKELSLKKFLTKFIKDCCSLCWLCHIFQVNLEVHFLSTLTLLWEYCVSWWKKLSLHDKNVLVVLGYWWRMQINWNYIKQ